MQLEPPQLRYEESQPWPFPASLMLGFRATVPRASPVAGAVNSPSKENGHGAQLLASKEARGAAIDSGITQAELRTCVAASLHGNLLSSGVLAAHTSATTRCTWAPAESRL